MFAVGINCNLMIESQQNFPALLTIDAPTGCAVAGIFPLMEGGQGFLISYGR